MGRRSASERRGGHFPPRLRRLDPSKWGDTRAIYAAAEAGVTQIDLGTGNARYKTSVSNAQVAVVHGTVECSEVHRLMGRAVDRAISTAKEFPGAQAAVAKAKKAKQLISHAIDGVSTMRLRR